VADVTGDGLCGIRARAAELLAELEIDIPADADLSGYWPLVVAGLRHEHSNYDKLLQELSEHCGAFTDWNDNREALAYCAEVWPPEADMADCPFKEAAYLDLKCGVNEAIRKVVSEP